MKHSFRSISLPVALALLASVVIYGCSSTTSSSPTPTPTSHTLKAGDTLDYHFHRVDSTGAVAADSTEVNHVLAVTASYMGMSNVAFVLQGVDTAFYVAGNDSTFALQQHSDSLGFGAIVPAVWIPYNTSENGTKVFDTTITARVNNVDDTAHLWTTVTYLGRSTTMIGTTMLNTYKYSRTFTSSVTYGKKNFTTTRAISHEFAPMVGFFTSRTEVITSNNPAVQRGTTTLTLTGYALH